MIKITRLTNNSILITQEDGKYFIAQSSSIIISIDLLRLILESVENDYTSERKSWSWKDNIFQYVGGRISEAE